MDIRNFHSSIAIKTVYSSISVEVADFFPLFILFQSVLGAVWDRLKRKNFLKRKKEGKAENP